METNSGRRRRALAWALSVLALVEAVYTVAALVVGDSSLAEAVGSYSVTNLAIGGSFAAAGGVIALHRPRHPVGWIMLLGGLGPLSAAASVPLGMYA